MEIKRYEKIKEVEKVEINQLIKVINGMLYMAEKEENPDDWTKDFLKDIKSVLEEHQEKI